SAGDCRGVHAPGRSTPSSERRPAPPGQLPSMRTARPEGPPTDTTRTRGAWTNLLVTLPLPGFRWLLLGRGGETDRGVAGEVPALSSRPTLVLGRQPRVVDPHAHRARTAPPLRVRPHHPAVREP